MRSQPPMTIYYPRVLRLCAAPLLILATISCTTPADKSLTEQLPDAPPGFDWELFEEVKVAILKPEGWHRKVTKGNTFYTGSVSVENIDEGGFFKTGFTVQVLSDLTKGTGHPPSVVASSLGNDIVQASYNTLLEVIPMKPSGSVSEGSIRYKNAPPGGIKITVHKYFAAHDHHDKLYIFTFEAPDALWNNAFEQYGLPMMRRIGMTR